MLEIREVSKVFQSRGRTVQALDGVDLVIRPGTFGLLGPNGSGKTTLMRILATLLQPTQGTVTFDGFDIHQHPQRLRARLGYLPQESGFYPTLTPLQFLRYLADVAGYHPPDLDAEIGRLLEQVNLAEHAHRPIRTLSGGMRRRLGVAQALLGQPDLIIVDEPTAGLDPEERQRLRRLIVDIAGQGRTVIVSTHITEDVESTCREVAVLLEGRVAYVGSTEALRASVEGRVWELVGVEEDTLRRIKDQPQVLGYRPGRGGFTVRMLNDGIPDIPCVDRIQVTPTLEDAYVALRQQHAFRQPDATSEVKTEYNLAR